MGAISLRDEKAVGSDVSKRVSEVRRRLKVRGPESSDEVPEKEKEGWRGRRDLSDI